MKNSTYGYPVTEAAKTAVAAVLRFAENEQSGIEKVIWACFDDRTLEAYQDEIDRH